MRMCNGWLRRFVLVAIFFAAGGALAQSRQGDAAETARLHGLFDAEWQWNMRTFPEWATYVGDHRYGDRLNDRSLKAEETNYAHARDRLAHLRAIDRAKLSSNDRVSYDIMLRDTIEWLEGEAHRGLRTQPIDASGGMHQGFAELLRMSPAATESDARNLLGRMAAFPASVDQVIGRMRAGMAMGWVTLRSSMERVPAQIDGQLTEDETKSPLYEPFTRLGRDLPEATRARLSLEGRRALKE